MLLRLLDPPGLFLLAPLALSLSLACGAPPAPAAAPSAPAAAPPAPAAPPTSVSRVRSADGVELAVEERGPRDARAIVFVHGLAFSREAFHRQMEGSLASRYHLVAYDLRGHGQSSRPAEADAYADGGRWADDLAAVLRETRAKDPIVVGWSLGGVILANYLRKHGDRAIAGAVFVDAVTRFAPEFFAPGNMRYMEGLTRGDDAARRDGTRAFLEASFVRPLPASEFERIASAAGVLPVDEHRAIQRISVDRGDEALASLRRPALVIHGARDAFLVEAMARHTAQTIPGARLSLYAGSGHAPFIDEAARFDDELARFADAARGDLRRPDGGSGRRLSGERVVRARGPAHPGGCRGRAAPARQ